MTANIFRNQGYIFKIPDEILIIIFQHLHIKDLLAIKRVCRRFYNLTKQDNLWKDVNLYPSILPLSNLYKIVKNNLTSHTRTLKLRGYVEAFKGKPKWKKQVWTKCFLDHLSQKCPSLQTFSLIEANIEQSVVLQDLPISLSVLQLCNCHINHASHFFRVSPERQSLKHLIELDLSNSAGVNDGTLGSIAELETLRVLRLFNCQVVKDSGLQYFAGHLGNLQHLDLGRTLITDISLHLLSQHHRKLTELSLIKCNITTNGTADLILSVKCLKTLNLQFTSVTNEGIGEKLGYIPSIMIVCTK